MVVQGVKTFKLERWLCLVTDWSRMGIGFVLWILKCSCKDINPACCVNIWTVVMVGSRFCTPAESRYAPIEGEPLGVQWALQKTSHFTLGCPKLLMLVDHKPLLGLLTKRDLGEIDNPRLLALAEKTMRRNSRLEHVAGGKNVDLMPYHAIQVPGGSRMSTTRLVTSGKRPCWPMFNLGRISG